MPLWASGSNNIDHLLMNTETMRAPSQKARKGFWKFVSLLRVFGTCIPAQTINMRFGPNSQTFQEDKLLVDSFQKVRRVFWDEARKGFGVH